eukprot:g5633.t1
MNMESNDAVGEELDRRAAQLAAELSAEFERKVVEFERKLKAELRARLAGSTPAGHAPLALAQLGRALEPDNDGAASDSGADHDGLGALKDMAMPHTHEKDEWEDVSLEPSVWSSALLCGTVPGDGAAPSALLAMLLLINVAIQAIFCFIVYEALSTPQITEDTVLEYRGWRRNVAHDYKFYNAASGKSLARRVCENDAGLEVSGEQAHVARSLFQYLGEGDGRDMTATGTLMASLALVIWSLSVVREVQSVWRMAGAVCAIPRGAHGGTRSSLQRQADGGAGAGEGALTFDSIGLPRLCTVLFAYAARVGLAVFLLIYGSLFLVYTIPLQDLLLNAVALEFVIMVDEVIFETLAPARVCRLVRDAAPLRVRTWRGGGGGSGGAGGRRRGLDVGTFSTLALAIAGATMPARNFPLGHNHASNYTAYHNLSYMPMMDAGRQGAGDVTYAMHVVDVLLQSNGRYTPKECSGDGVCECGEECNKTHPIPHPDRPACCLAQKTYANQIDAGRFSVRTRSMDDTIRADGFPNDWRAVKYLVMALRTFGCEAVFTRTGELYNSGRLAFSPFVYGINLWYVFLNKAYP